MSHKNNSEDAIINDDQIEHGNDEVDYSTAYDVATMNTMQSACLLAAETTMKQLGISEVVLADGASRKTPEKTEEKADSKIVKKLIEDLDNDSFFVRERATAQLIKLGGKTVKDAIDSLIKATDSYEVRSRGLKIKYALETPQEKAERLKQKAFAEADEILENNAELTASQKKVCMQFMQSVRTGNFEKMCEVLSKHHDIIVPKYQHINQAFHALGLSISRTTDENAAQGATVRITEGNDTGALEIGAYKNKDGSYSCKWEARKDENWAPLPLGTEQQFLKKLVRKGLESLGGD